LGNARGQRQRFGRIERQAQLEEHVLQAHHAQAHRAPLAVGGGGGGYRVEVEVDHPVELAHGGAHGGGELVVVDGTVHHVARQVDRAEVAHRRLAGVGDFQDLGAQVGQVDDVVRLGGLVAG